MGANIHREENNNFSNAVSSFDAKRFLRYQARAL
jgi:hypothetical protein